MNAYEVHPAQTFPNHPEWPVYEAPARWYIQVPDEEASCKPRP